VNIKSRQIEWVSGGRFVIQESTKLEILIIAFTVTNFTLAVLFLFKMATVYFLFPF